MYTQNNTPSTESSALRQLQENWQWYLILGIGLVVTGILAILFCVKSTLVSVIYIGFLLLMLAFFEAAQSFRVTKWSSFFLHAALAVLYGIGGALIVYNPAANALSLTLLLALFLVVSGIMKIIVGFLGTTPHKGSLIINGILTLILGILIWSQWPVSGLWVLGTLVGIDAIVTGCTWIALSLHAKKLTTNHKNF
jgi:uncharacterized membrane protein HdeD (DUF308 family)